MLVLPKCFVVGVSFEIPGHLFITITGILFYP